MNSAYVDELYFDFLRDPDSVSAEWQRFFKSYTPETLQRTDVSAGNGNAGLRTGNTPSNGTQSVPGVDSVNVEARKPTSVTSTAPPVTVAESRMPVVGSTDELVPLSSIGSKIAENMEHSLRVPTATSVRSIPVKALEENRLVINEYRSKVRQPKLSFTHILAWAIVKALEHAPNLNNTYGVNEGVPVKVVRKNVNLGLAVDVVRRDGSRVLLVPSVKNANLMNFREFVAAYNEIITKARTNKLTPDDLTGATVTLTNPGMIGTVMSMPRLMEGQGTIIAAGSIEYPAGFQAMLPEVLHTLAVSKVVNVTSTYDHRIIQGAESGEFLLAMHQLLIGELRFYDQIYAAIGIPFEPLRWAVEQGRNPLLPQEQPDIVEKESHVIQLIASYRVRGHVLADVNPLGLEAYNYPELDPAHYGFTIWDLDREFDTGGLGFVKRTTLRNILTMLRETYCHKIGIEWMHIQDHEKRTWIQNQIEGTSFRPTLTAQQKIATLRELVRAESLETFLQTRFLGAKRFSIEGGESTMVILDQMLHRASEQNLRGAVLGMAHRGRLNVLVNKMGKPLEVLFNEFEGSIDPESYQGSGDVKYHLGARGTYVNQSGQTLPMFLAPNPSHLEAVNPVVEGIARALIDEEADETMQSVLPILIHGDAAFAGQGVVAETLNMARLAGYHTGGTLHIIINNQIGFTASPEDSRSTPYASGVAKMLQVPVLHVNGDDPEACRTAADLAFAFRQQFSDDVVVDMYCYRKYGHNEQDDPTATQPLLYKKIKNKQPVHELYQAQLVAEGVISLEDGKRIAEEEHAILQGAFDARSGVKVSSTSPARLTYDMFAPVSTAISKANVDTIVAEVCSIPADFNIHAKVKAEVEKRVHQHEQGIVQWGMAEALAFGSLISEGHAVRITGQDTGRGTFNHRQAVQSDVVNERKIIPLNRLASGNKRLHIYDSCLSEYAILGFEYGYSTIAKNDLTIWEAQFGDFANGAQITIDQFVSSAEEKWGQRSNITMLLPHGYDGQGPEHSSARLERFLQLCAQDNMIVSNYTSPANYFHAIRRQVKAEWRKPLVVMTPKGYLRIFSSAVQELYEGSYTEIFDDSSIINPSEVQRIIVTTGKVHFEVAKKREQLGRQSQVALIRLEQIYPFNAPLMRTILHRYPNATDVIWCQEEPRNMGAWTFVNPLLQESLLMNQRLQYSGRPTAASPATGSAKIHDREQDALLTGAFREF